MFHYFRLVPEKARVGIDELADALNRAKGDRGVYRTGPTFMESRADYADDIVEDLSHRGAEAKEAQALHEAVLRLVGAAGRFIQMAEIRYFTTQLPRGVVTR